MNTPIFPQNPWKIAEVGFPWKESASQKLKFLLNYAVLSPSVHNTQPWSFRVLDDEVEFFADSSRALNVLDPAHRQLVMSCGSALYHLRLAVKHYRHQPIVHTFPDQDKPNLLARVRIVDVAESTLDEHRLFMAIKKRRTYRGPFEDRPIPTSFLAEVRLAAEREHVQMDVITEPDQKAAVAALLGEAVDLQQRNERLRAELASWNRAPGVHEREGVPAFARITRGETGSGLQDWGGEKIRFDPRDAELAPALAVISTPLENRVAWLNTGQGLAAMLLMATVHSMAASFLNQVVEVPATRAGLARIVGRTHPQLVLRLGYPDGLTLEQVPRQPVDEKIVTHALYNDSRGKA